MSCITEASVASLAIQALDYQQFGCTAVWSLGANYQVLGTDGSQIKIVKDGSQISCLLQQFGKLTHSYDFLFCLQHKAIDRVLAEVKGWRAKWSVEKSSDLRCCFTGRDIFAVFSCASFHTCHTSFQLCFWTETSGYARRWICQILCRKPDNKASSCT